VLLPAVGTLASGTPALHVFAMTVGSTTAGGAAY
jgi:hypothetical protein